MQILARIEEEKSIHERRVALWCKLSNALM